MKIRLILCFLVLVSIDVEAQTPTPQSTPTVLSELGLFARCYGHLTQQRVKITDPLYLDVKEKRKTALAACTIVLDSAKLTAASGTTIVNTTDSVAKSVLFSMHQLHRSWSRDRGFAQRLFDTEFILSLRGWYEDSPIGSYITRALFAPGKTVDSVVVGTEYLQPVRTDMDPPHVSGGVPNPNLTPPLDWRLGALQPFAPKGELLGIRPVPIKTPLAFLTPGPIPSTFSDLTNIETTPTVVKSFTTINFPTITEMSEPIASITKINFGVRFKGKINVATAGSYTFYLDVDDTAMLIIDGERVVANKTSGDPLTLTVGQHPFEIQYFQRSAGARLIFSYQGPGITKQVVPATAMVGLNAEYFTQLGFAPMVFTGNQGGGFLGNHNYLLNTYNIMVTDYVPDGQILTDRSYARSVISDTLCREAPVIRIEDAQPFVDENSETPFRREAGCSVCHATLDRLSGATVRGLRWNIIPTSNTTNPAMKLIGTMGLNFITPTFNADSSWPAVLDPSYARRVPSGHLFFRNYRGDLVNIPIKSFAELGNAIKQQDDYYICFAKRYYKYFTGIDVAWGDPGDENYPSLSKSEGYHLDTVINLGMQLKQHKSLRTLILSILGSAEYKMTDFGVTYGGP